MTEFLLFFSLFVAFSSGHGSTIIKPTKPAKCVDNLSILYRLCCILPPFFTNDVAKSCGGAFELVMYINNNGGTSLQRRFTNLETERKAAYDEQQKIVTVDTVTMKTIILQCAHWYCILDKYEFISRSGLLDHEKFFEHLDTWANMNQAFTDVARFAKIHCRQVLRFYFPLKPCEFYKLNLCLRNFMSVNCPVTLPAKECGEQKELYRDCKKYLL